MLMHLLKSLWKRKAKHMMISMEIMLIFIVIFAVTVGVVYNVRLYHRPLGFEVQDRWRVALQTSDGGLNQVNPQLVDNFKRSLLALPEVESVSSVQYEPYNNSAFIGDYRRPEQDKKTSTYFMSMDDDAAKVIGIPLTQGHWFSNVDEGQAETAVVINRRLAETLFPNENPIGKSITAASQDEKDQKLSRIVGVVESYRYFGEFMGDEKMALFRHSPITQAPLQTMVIKVKPGTPRQFEIKLYQQLKLIRNDMEYGITTLDEERNEIMRQKASFFIPPILIAGFLLIMVSFGLFGVLWQNTTSRIPELGLRRAVGASSTNIYTQIVLEQALLSSLAMALGLAFLIQLPFTGIFAKFMDWSNFFLSAAISMCVIYLVSLICSLYPAWMASQMSPTEALHYE